MKNKRISSYFKKTQYMMHTAFAISTEGLTLAILDQKLCSRLYISKEVQELKKRKRCRSVNIEDRESIKWLESLKKTNKIKRLFDLAEGWQLAHELYICG